MALDVRVPGAAQRVRGTEGGRQRDNASPSSRLTMRYTAVMFSAFRDLFHRPHPPAPPAQPSRRLVAETESEFFAWFHLESDGEPVLDDDGFRHRFRPLGEAFRPLVLLDVVTDVGDGIRFAHLCLDRSFVSGPENAFARDIAKSFLGWILDEAAQDQAAPLIANIGNLAAANRPVITAGELPQPPEDPTGAYAVFIGDADAAALVLGSAMLTLANVDGRLTIEVELLD